MSSPIDRDVLDRVNNIRVIGAVDQSDFDGHIISLSLTKAVQPSFLLRVRAKVVISLECTWFGTIKLQSATSKRDSWGQHTKETA
jgi:hypothetical protein